MPQSHINPGESEVSIRSILLLLPFTIQVGETINREGAKK